MTMKTTRVHFGPNPALPFRTLCGAGKSSLTAHGRARWRSVLIGYSLKVVTCPACKRLAKGAK
jgi:hypothetical protein